MSDLRDPLPLGPIDDPIDPPASASDPAPSSEYEPSSADSPFVLQGPELPQQNIPDETPFFHYVPPPRPPERIPHMGHIGILCLIAVAGLALAALLAQVGVSYHVFGVKNLTDAATDVHYTLGTEGVFYLLTLAGALLVFPLLWHKSLFAGLQWRADIARRRSGYLISAAIVCFILAMFDGLLMPGPVDAPIDRIFRMPGAAWILFAFGVTLAPFFEELGFRGFLLPALSTSFDWIAEKASGELPHPIDENGHPQWSMPAMIVASVLTSILFAFLHADQTGWSLGPFLLLVLVSLVLCGARLITRSLAASVFVHACYNFLLFSFMLIGTGGFKHLDKM
jgi:uncharacterized protein